MKNKILTIGFILFLLLQIFFIYNFSQGFKFVIYCFILSICYAFFLLIFAFKFKTSLFLQSIMNKGTIIYVIIFIVMIIFGILKK